MEERRVEDNDVGYVGEQFACHLDAAHASWVVERGKGNEVTNFFDNVIIDNGGVREDGSALNDSVTYRNNVGVGEAWAVGVKEAKDFAKTMTVVSDGQFFAVFFSVVTVLDEAVAFPMRSTSPPAIASPEVGSTSWYLIVDDPALMTRTVACDIPGVFSVFVGGQITRRAGFVLGLR